MESLLDNPMKAVLYLKELTTIVQNQQSLIQTQRQRIDELERKVEDLIGENRQLRDPHHYVQQPAQHHHHHHHHPTHRSASPQATAHLHQPQGSNKAAAHLGQQHPRSSSSSSRSPVYLTSLSNTRPSLRRPPTTRSSCSSSPPRRSHLKQVTASRTPPRTTRGAPAASRWFRRLPPLSAAQLDWLGKQTTKQCFTSSAAQPQTPLRGRPLLLVSPGFFFRCLHLAK
uniref:IQ motif and Sec7 domain ArfGEF 3b n=1 Tax=Monopterus albus TaxID=43700 RepID=A0A3Q3JR87_MONAL